ncbi:MAG: SpoIIE family protein phosphatase [Solirubrobacterales bacterium]|nr:SpoIIE family protein phosphatase [Solirubrobacterales bacterium]
MSVPAVLLVDDHPENLLALEAVLAPLEVRLVRASSGEEALRAVLADEFAAILLDVQMPGMDGFETATLIRGRERSARTPIIFLTALSTDVEHVTRGYEAGAVDYVLKPFDATILRSKVGVFCDLARLRSEREQAGALLRAAWDGAPDGIALVYPDGRVGEVNPALLTLTGRLAADTPPSIDVLVDADDRAAMRALHRRVSRGEAATDRLELSLRSLDGEELPVSVLASAVAAAEAGPATVLLQVTDLREQRRARASQLALTHEQAAREEAEAIATRLAAIAAITEGLEGRPTAELVEELCGRLKRVLGLAGVAVRVLGDEHRVVADASVGTPVDPAALHAQPSGPVELAGASVVPMRVDDRLLGVVAVLGLHAEREQRVGSEALLHTACERATLMLERARLFERERLIAATLQRDLLPETLPSVPGVRASAYFTSGGDGVRIGGDWYDALALPGGRLALVVGDVAGHGVTAAARMAELRAVARAYVLEGHGPSEVLRQMNAYHLSMGSDSMVTVVCAIVEPDRDRARFAAAGHMPPILAPATREEPAQILTSRGPPLGVLEVGVYEEREIAFPAGALLALYTDGLVERRGEVLDAGLERLRASLSGREDDDVDAARTRAVQACLAGGGGDDDVTLVVVRAQERLGTAARYTLTAVPEPLGAMRRHLRRWLEEAGARPVEAAEITMAANEAMQNAIEHGNAYAVAPITVSLELRDDAEVVIVVQDLGHDGPLDPDPDRGRGLELMRALCDEARFDLGGPMGGSVTLRRRLQPAGER